MIRYRIQTHVRVAVSEEEEKEYITLCILFLYVRSRQVAQTVATALGHQSGQTSQNRLRVDHCAENQT